jgi:hypothetical protein
LHVDSFKSVSMANCPLAGTISRGSQC